MSSSLPAPMLEPTDRVPGGDQMETVTDGSQASSTHAGETYALGRPRRVGATMVIGTIVVAAVATFIIVQDTHGFGPGYPGHEPLDTTHRGRARWLPAHAPWR
jgi:hypothetical protein